MTPLHVAGFVLFLVRANCARPSSLLQSNVQLQEVIFRKAEAPAAHAENLSAAILQLASGGLGRESRLQLANSIIETVRDLDSSAAVNWTNLTQPGVSGSLDLRKPREVLGRQLLQGLSNSSAEDQSRLNADYEALKWCGRRQRSAEGELQAALGLLDAARADHRSCRLAEAAAAKGLGSNLSSPMHSPEFWRVECDGLQASFERAHCSYGTKATSVCIIYSSCFEQFAHKLAETEARVRDNEAHRDELSKAGMTIICHLDVILDDSQTQNHSGCADNTQAIDIGSLNITYPLAPGMVVCDASNVSGSPCDEAWIASELSAWMPDGVLAADCSECPLESASAVLKTSTTTTTIAATTITSTTSVTTTITQAPVPAPTPAPLAASPGSAAAPGAAPEAGGPRARAALLSELAPLIRV